VREDQELVKLVLAGESKAFEELVRRYEAGVFRFIYNMVNNKETTEDITQETFISAYNKLYTFKNSCKFSSWLYQIAKNRCIDHIRKYSNKKEVGAELLNVIPSDVSPESFVEYMEMKNTVESFITTLGDVERQILFLRYSYEHLTFGDIADILKMGEAAVKKRYYKIYDKYEVYIEKRAGNGGLKKVMENA
jgi:RNA polymerase sigma factor (sigma-70 family)